MLFIVVNIIHSEFDSNKIPTAYFKPRGFDYLLLHKCDCLGRPRCDYLVFYLSCCLFYPLFQPQAVIKKSTYSVARSYIKISRYFSQIKRTCIKSVLNFEMDIQKLILFPRLLYNYQPEKKSNLRCRTMTISFSFSFIKRILWFMYFSMI